MNVKDRIKQRLDEGVVMSGTKVGRVIADNVKKTTEMRGKVDVSIFRQKTVVAILGSAEHVFNATLKSNGSWGPGNSGMKGAPAAVIGSQKTFDDATAAKALQALFDKA